MVLRPRSMVAGLMVGRRKKNLYNRKYKTHTAIRKEKIIHNKPKYWIYFVVFVIKFIVIVCTQKCGINVNTYQSRRSYCKNKNKFPLKCNLYEL